MCASAIAQREVQETKSADCLQAEGIDSVLRSLRLGTINISGHLQIPFASVLCICYTIRKGGLGHE
ncbi:hypothetical protein BRYFOR_05398 [Marvinbryantia formatexigens DSM 14469]|uniref:Uncharacterized protein n=1 Tax=Marvinbryantia formatexigens DSM 14469 TaxID=478749 RepID=C6L9V8_9FIRM|nr:hypothetical protein BRYFOR_05398 [Marvinbryantia formatexigens DSM 14469]